MADINNLTNALNYFKHKLLLEINTSILCEVVSFDPATQRATVQPLIKGLILNDNGDREIVDSFGDVVRVSNYDLPPMLNLPCQSFKVAENCYMSMPIVAGTVGIAIISERDVTNWKKSGGIQSETSTRKFDVNDGFFIYGFSSLEDSISDYSDTDVVIKNKDTKVSIAPDGNVAIEGNVEADTVEPANGASGVFVNTLGNTLTIDKGIITNIT